MSNAYASPGWCSDPYRSGSVWRSPRPGHHAAAVDPDLLHADADPRVAVANEVAMRRHPQRRDVEPAGDVQPLDDHRAVRVRRVGRPVHDEPGGEVRGVLRSPPTIGRRASDRPSRCMPLRCPSRSARRSSIRPRRGRTRPRTATGDRRAAFPITATPDDCTKSERVCTCAQDLFRGGRESVLVGCRTRSRGMFATMSSSDVGSASSSLPVPAIFAGTGTASVQRCCDARGPLRRRRRRPLRRDLRSQVRPRRDRSDGRPAGRARRRRRRARVRGRHRTGRVATRRARRAGVRDRALHRDGRAAPGQGRRAAHRT